MHNKRIAIVGAGMGGLTLALLLQRAGYDFVVYEQAAALAKVGAGINLAPNSTRLFRRLGLEDRLRAAGLAHREKLSRDWKTGAEMFSYPLEQLIREFGAPFLAFHRGALQDILLEQLDGDAVRFGKRLKTLEQDGPRVNLTFEDGSTETADMVVGADGVHSRVRGILFPRHQPRYFGTVGYRSLIPVSKIRGPFPADNTKWWAPDRFVLNYFIDEKREVLNMITGSPASWDHEGWSPRAATTGELLQTFAGFHPDVQRVIEAAEDISKWPMLDCDPFVPWHKGACVLLGDACHATTPHMGQGAGMAFEDAVILARCIADGKDDPIDVIFQRYTAVRYDRTSRIQLESRDNLFARTGMSHGWLFGYDVFETPLPA